MEEYRGDIDTLLAFAGLFSAILTALVVQFTTILASDACYETSFPLRTLNVHTSAFAAGYSNSASHSFLSIPPYKAPPWTIFVITLWLASLVCSLCTAFVAILVKHRLREDLQPTYASDRKIFQIAAALAWFLQASHGLFILGLGLFTAAIDEHSVRTTTMLVVSWTLAIFVVATDIGLLLFPLYPYKVTSLKPILETSRRVLSLLYVRLSRPPSCPTRLTLRSILPLYGEDPSRVPLLRQQPQQIVIQKQYGQQYAVHSEQLEQQPAHLTDVPSDDKSTARSHSSSNGQPLCESRVVQQCEPEAYRALGSMGAPPPQAAPQGLPPTGAWADGGRRILFYVTALYDYRAVIDEEFDFQSGDVIAVTATPEDGWWSGELLDEARKQPGRHIFPSNYVRMLPP
ncbi:hypothetical protein PsYK624_153090 [Phanerochaete sordida]|uniref:SH3 domain-containing protein n=1 Tax=Phanerochaete sordida TaxID=48140 RepID=A0A9P3GQ69_9APHY|nr:hypothetical protein PsYK624_153090 [Phanerochaete sordida]